MTDDDLPLIRRQFLMAMGYPEDGERFAELLGMLPLSEEGRELMNAETYRNLSHVMSLPEVNDVVAACSVTQTDLTKVIGSVPDEYVDAVVGYHSAAMVALLAVLYSRGLIRLSEGTPHGQ